MSPPPPRPPIICYDLQTSKDARRTVCASRCAPFATAQLRSRKTVVHRDASDLQQARASFAQNHFITRTDDIDGAAENRSSAATSSGYRSRLRDHKTLNNSNLRSLTSLTNNSIPQRQSYYSTPSAAILYDHDTKLKSQVEPRERRLAQSRRHLALRAELDLIAAQLEESKRLQENLLRIVGISQQAAKYLEERDKECQRLERKVEEFKETHSKELDSRLRQTKNLLILQKQKDLKLEEIRLRDSQRLKYSKSGGLSDSSTNSIHQETGSTTTASSMSTSSPKNYTPHESTSFKQNRSKHCHKIFPQNLSPLIATPQNGSQMQTSTQRKVSPKTKKEFSFYKPNLSNETLEVTDIKFFEKVEDKTMMEVDQLLKNMQSVLKD